MASTCQMSISVCLLGCLIFPISGLARVDNRTGWRPANTTTHNQGWKSPSAVPTAQWGRNNQTSTVTNNSQRNNYTQQFLGTNQHHGHHKKPIGWGGSSPSFYNASRPQLNNPWVRNNQSASPQSPQQNIGWGVRPNVPIPTSNYSGFGQSNGKHIQQHPWGGGGGVVTPQNQSNGGWSHTRPVFNGTSGFNAGSGWNSPPTNFTRPYAATPANSNFGFGQNTWVGSGGGVPTQNQPIYNGTFPGFNNPPKSQPNQSFVGGGWNPGYNAGQIPPAAPLSPIGGFGSAPLTPLAGGGQASLSYPNGQPAPASQQKPVGGNTNPYGYLFN